MADETDPAKRSARAILVNKLLHFISQVLAHSIDATFSLALVLLRQEEYPLRMNHGDLILQQFHIYIRTLEAMDEDEQMASPVIIFIKGFEANFLVERILLLVLWSVAPMLIALFEQDGVFDRLLPYSEVEDWQGVQVVSVA